MTRLFGLFVTVTLLAALVSAAAAEELPWKPGQPQEPAAPDQNQEATPQKEGGVDLKEALSPEVYQRAIQPILVQIGQAEKVLALYDKEMAKEEKARNEKRAIGYRLSAARFYLAASQQARQKKNLIKEADLQAAVTAQYEVPMRDKAVGIYLTLAQEAMDKNDLKAAIEYYQQALKIDPENAVAKEELTKLAELAKQHAAQGAGGQTAGSGAKDETAQESIRRSAQDYQEKHQYDDHKPSDYQERSNRSKKY